MSTAISGLLQALDTASGKVLVEHRGRSFTGADLRRRIDARAADLWQAGLRRDRTVLILVSENLCAIEQLIACWILGASGMFVDFRSPKARVEEWAQRLSPALVVGLRGVPGLDVHVQPRDPASADTPPSPLDPEVDRPAVHVSSSGTTGLPNMHEVMQARLLTVLKKLNTDLDLGRPGATLSAVSVAFSAANYLWLRNILANRPIVALDLVYRLEELDTALQRPEVIECALPPGVIRRLAGLPSAKVPRYPQLVRFASVGGPARPEDKVAAVTRLSPAYVMNYSFVGIGIVSRITGAEILERPASCGRPSPATPVEIRDGDRLCAPGEIGEVVASAENKPPYRPGDLGWLDAEGYLYITGRVQGLLVRNGVNFSAERLVAAALALPDVIDAGVVALPGTDEGDEIHLIVQAAPLTGSDLAARLDHHLRQTLPAAEQPDRLHLWPDLPMTAGGKIDQRALRQTLKDRLGAA